MYININFPFRESKEGNFIDLTKTDQDAIKADLLHFILTSKGQRYYYPSFGTDLKKKLFNQLDDISSSEILEEINGGLKKFLPNLNVTSIDIIENEDTTLGTFTVTINYTVTEDVFNISDSLTFKI